MTKGERQMAAAFAACLLETDGWCQQTLFTEVFGDGPHCIVGSIGVFMDDLNDAWLLADEVVTVCRLTPPPSIYNRSPGVSWNNVPERTAKEVIMALRTYADHEEQVYVEVIDLKAPQETEVVGRMGPMSEGRAERVEMGLLQSMDLEKYSTRTVPA